MTDAQIMAEFRRMEKLMNRTPQGADYDHITRTVAAMAGITEDDVRRIVRDRTFTDPN